MPPFRNWCLYRRAAFGKTRLERADQLASWPQRIVSGIAGLLSGALLLRYRDVTLLMLTLAVAALLYELANTASAVTGGFDGLIGIEINPIFGRFEWTLMG